MISDSVIKAWRRHQDTLPPLAFSYQLTVKKRISLKNPALSGIIRIGESYLLQQIDGKIKG